MISILRPRRGKKATAETQNIVLKAGEIFFEYPDTGVGTGTGRVKMGNGVTAYKDLPYFLDISNLDIDVDDSAVEFEYTGNNSTVADILNKDIVSGNKLKDLIGAIKQAISVLKTSLEKTNSTVSATAQAVNQHESDIGTLVTSVGTNTSNITSLKSRVSSLESNGSNGTLVMEYVHITHPNGGVYHDPGSNDIIEENKITNFFGLILDSCGYSDAEILSFVFMGGGYKMSGLDRVYWQQGLTMEIFDESFKNDNGTIYINCPEPDGDESGGSSLVTELFFQVLLKV